jgi:hypothetical protein
MKNSLLIISALIMLSPAAFAQNRPDRPRQYIRSDYNQVSVVARVRIKSVKLAAPDIHPLYAARGEVVESFKGKLKRGQSFEFYISAEEDYDINKALGDWIVFLTGSANTPNGKWGWFELENSSLPASKNNLAAVRQIKYVNKRPSRKRSLTTRSALPNGRPLDAEFRVSSTLPGVRQSTAGSSSSAATARKARARGW